VYKAVEDDKVLLDFDQKITRLATNISPTQRRVGWALWNAKAKELGEDLPTFVKRTLADVQGEREFSLANSLDEASPSVEPLELKQNVSFSKGEDVVYRDPGTKELVTGKYDGPLEKNGGSVIIKDDGKKFIVSPKKTAFLRRVDDVDAAETALESFSASSDKFTLKNEKQFPSGDALPIENPTIPLKEGESISPSSAPTEPLTAIDGATKGAVRFHEDGRAIMFLFANADFSTLAHESFHIWRRMGLTPVADAAMRKSFGVAEGSPWSREQEEEAARAFERFLADGHSPKKELDTVFDQTKQWMTSIYRELQNSDIAKPVSEEARRVFGGMFKGEESTLLQRLDITQPILNPKRKEIGQLLTVKEISESSPWPELGIDEIALRVVVTEGEVVVGHGSQFIHEDLVRQLKTGKQTRSDLVIYRKDGKLFARDVSNFPYAASTKDDVTITRRLKDWGFSPSGKNLWSRSDEAGLLFQSAKDRVTGVIGEDVIAAAKGEIQRAVKEGLDPAETLEDLALGRFNGLVNEFGSAGAAARAMVDEILHDANSGVISHEFMLTEARRHLKELIGSGADLPAHLSKNVEATRTAYRTIVETRIANVMRSARLQQAVENLEAAKRLGTGLPDAEAAFNTATRESLEMIAVHDQLQTNYARAVNAMGIKVDVDTMKGLGIDNAKAATDAVDYHDKLVKLWTEPNGELSRERFMSAMLAAGGDASVTRKFLEGMTAFLKGSNGGKGPLHKMWSAYLEFWTNGILSGMRTFSANFLNNVAGMFLSPIEQGIGAVLTRDKATRQQAGRVLYHLTHQSLDFFGLSNFTSRMQERLGTSARQEALKAWSDFNPRIENTLKATDSTDLAISAKSLGMNPETSMARGVDTLGRIVNTPSRILMTTDELFKQMQFRSRVMAEAEGDAISAGLTKDATAFNDYVADKLAKAFQPETGKAQTWADRHLWFAREATFTQNLAEGSLGSILQTAAAKVWFVKPFIPFVRTPVNIATRLLQSVPGLGMLQRDMLDMIRSGDPARRATAYGRQAIGAMFWTAAASWAVGGRITGGGPSDPRERQALLDIGWQPYSFVVEDAGKKTYYSYQRFDPNGMILGLAADYVEASQNMDNETATEVAAAMILPIARNVTSRTYLRGLSELVNVLSQPDRKLESMLKQRAASHVWSFVAGLNQDEYLREARTVLDAVKARVPGQSTTLSPRRNVLGEALHSPMYDAPVARAISPIAVSRSADDSVKTELANLSYGFSPPSEKMEGIDLTSIQNAQGQDAYDRLQELVGQVELRGKTVHSALKGLVESDTYKALPSPTEEDQQNPRLQSVQRVLFAYRSEAKKQLLKEFPEIAQTLKSTAKASRQNASPTIQRILSY
jgi:hypothetical protein